MGEKKSYLREQFRWNKFTLKHEDASKFYLSCWQSNHATLPLVFIRLVLFLGSVAILTASLVLRVEGDLGYWIIYMTNWGILLMIVASGLACAVSAVAYLKGPIDAAFGLPWYVQLFWAAYNTAITIGFFITIFYYVWLYNPDREFVGYPVLDLFVHGINSVVMFILLMTSQHPTQILHFIYPLTFAIIYLVFSIIYYYAGGVNGFGERWIYPMLDWSNPGLTTGMVFACAESIIVLHCVVVLLSLLRDYISKRFVGDFDKITISASA